MNELCRHDLLLKGCLQCLLDYAEFLRANVEACHAEWGPGGQFARLKEQVEHAKQLRDLAIKEGDLFYHQLTRAIDLLERVERYSFRDVMAGVPDPLHDVRVFLAEVARKR